MSRKLRNFGCNMADQILAAAAETTYNKKEARISTAIGWSTNRCRLGVPHHHPTLLAESGFFLGHPVLEFHCIPVYRRLSVQA